MKYGVSRVNVEITCSLFNDIEVYAALKGISCSQAAAEFIYTGLNKFVDQIEAYREDLYRQEHPQDYE